jgi:cytochrome c-type biogenesis protein CcmH/NrfG
MLLGRHDEAVEPLNHALRINPFDVEIHSLLVEIFERQGDQKAMDIETAALKILRQDPTWGRKR